MGTNIVLTPRFGFKRKISFGLRFIKQNVPEVEILEYPLWEEYCAKLKEGWDIVGFSCFQDEIGKVQEMALEARRHKIKELWCGGYGALDQSIPKYFDRVIFGYGEEFLSSVYGYKLNSIQHPFLPIALHLVPSGLRYKLIGVIQTQRGCPHRCTFCQTPSFDPTPKKLPLESIEQVIKAYKSAGFDEIVIIDELFGMFSDHSDRVAELMRRNKMHWWVQTNPSIFLRKARFWRENGLATTFIGIESLSENALKRYKKVIHLEDIKETVRLGRELDLFMIGFYMIGDEEATVESTIEELRRVYELGFHAYQLCVLTPFPRTPLWYYIDEKYGIDKDNYHLFNAKTLVWNHPNISRAQMNYLFSQGSKIINRPFGHYGKGIMRIALRRIREHSINFVPKHLLYPPLRANLFDERNYIHLHPS